jgi:hypothetical protein
VGPENREKRTEIKRIADMAYWDLIPQLLLAGATNVIGNCSQKILVFVLQMEESKQNMWMG